MAAEDNAELELDLVHVFKTNAAASVYTRTYDTAARTIPAAVAIAVPTTASTSTTPFGYSQAQADDIVTTVNALVADNLALRQLIVALVHDLEAVGIAG